MKAARYIQKITAIAAAIGAVACLVATYWETIVDAFYAVAAKLEAKKEQFCGFIPSEYDDYDDGALKQE